MNIYYFFEHEYTIGDFHRSVFTSNMIVDLNFKSYYRIVKGWGSHKDESRVLKCIKVFV